MAKYKRRGGVIVMPIFMLNSEAYLALTSYSRSLLVLMQIHWYKYKPVDYGVREAAVKMSCNERTARKAFDQLQELGFIECMEQSVFRSRTQSKARSWRLTWMPYKEREPTDDWRVDLGK